MDHSSISSVAPDPASTGHFSVCLRSALDGRTLWSAGLILIAGFFYMDLVSSRPITSIGGDQLVYHQIATNMLAGRGFSQCISAPYLPTLTRTPLYPTFLAAIYSIFGIGNYEAVRIVQILLMLLTSAMLFWLTFLTFGCRLTALLSMALCTFHGFNYNTGIGVYGYLFTEPLAILCTTSTILCAAIACRSAKMLPYAICGFFSGLAMLTRPSNLLLPIALSLFFLLRRATLDTLKRISLILAVSATLVLPWTVRNYVQFSLPIILSTPLSGLAVFSGSIIANPDFIPYPDSDFRMSGSSIPPRFEAQAREALSGLYREFNLGGSGGTEDFPLRRTSQIYRHRNHSPGLLPVLSAMGVSYPWALANGRCGQLPQWRQSRSHIESRRKNDSRLLAFPAPRMDHCAASPESARALAACVPDL